MTFAASSDDAEQESDEIDALFDDDIDTGWEGAPKDFNILTCCLRFQNICIPKGARIKSIRKYYADPEMGNDELALFGQEDFTEDREGIALWPTGDSTGYIIVSNQQDMSFNIYDRNPEQQQHSLLGNRRLSTVETDGCELLTKPLGPDFPNGLFVAMSEDTTFHYYTLDLPKIEALGAQE